MILLLGIAIMARAAAPALSVCAAIRAGYLDRKTVRITGEWRSLSGMGLFDELVDDSCPELGAIHVVFTADGQPFAAPKSYRLNVRSAEHAQRITEKALADNRKVAATIEGVLYLQKHADYAPERKLPNGVIVPAPDKWYPLVLLVESIPEIREQ